ncbi:MAG: RNA methyltransferase, partial [Acidimicrobiia bacterium]|nr:RNA methyltransferase [Acidimicrobiia bacterium]
LMGGSGPVLVLADVADPGNVGTLVRTAEAAGAAGVVVTGSSADPFGPKAVRASAGSAARVPIAEVAVMADVLQAATSAARRTVATVVAGGSAPETIDLADPVCLLLGSEAHGLDDATVAACTTSVTVPMAGAVESVNVAIAGAVVLFEIARQRRSR